MNKTKDSLGIFLFIAFAGAWGIWIPYCLGPSGLGLFDFSLPAPFLVIGTFTGPMLAVFLANDKKECRSFIQKIFRFRFSYKIYLLAFLASPFVILTTTSIWLLEFRYEEIGTFLLYYMLSIPIIFFFGPLGEEPGWRGFALSRMQARYGRIKGRTLLGVIWAVWHLPLILFVPAYNENVSPWVLTPVLFATIICINFFICWIYEASGERVFSAIIMHAAWNSSVASFDKLAGLEIKAPALISAAAVLAIIAIFLENRDANNSNKACVGISRSSASRNPST